MKTWVTATKPKTNSNRTIFKPEMAYLQVCTRTCSTFSISQHTNPARFILHSKFFLIQLLLKKNSLQSYTVQCRTKTEPKTMNQIPKSPLRMSSLGVVHCICYALPYCHDVCFSIKLWMCVLICNLV